MHDRSPRLRFTVAKQGQPLLFLATVVLLWVAARAVHHLMPAVAALPDPPSRGPRLPASAVTTAKSPPAHAGHGLMSMLGFEAHAAVRNARAEPAIKPSRRAEADFAPPAMPAEIALSDQRLWVGSLPTGGSGTPGNHGSPLVDRPLGLSPEHTAVDGMVPEVAGSHPAPRWSLYGWSLVRQGSRVPVLAAGGQYGGSQAGLLVRLGLGGQPSAPAMYVRATSALASADDRSLAFGVSARPWAGIPVDLAVERRLAPGTPQRDQFAAMLVGGTSFSDPRSRVQVDGYGQAGVIGLNDRRGFFDLQMQALRPVATADRSILSVGAGLWAGGQQNIGNDGTKRWLHRIDIGPRAAVTFPVDGGRMTLAVDWRQRIDGDALPQSGAAITLSAGF